VAESEMRNAAGLPLMTRLAKVFAEPLRIRIVAALNVREMSPKEFHREFGGGSLSRVSRHFDLLAEYGWIYQTKTETGGPRRGATEHFYRATGPAVFDEEIWPDLPPSMKEMVSARIFEEFAERVRAAMESRTIDAREDRHFSWAPMLLDQQGWDSAIAKVDALFYWFFEEQEEANLRMAESGEEPIPMTIALAAFESPQDTEKQP
jgi:DNA-binding transcriptional ArsR family regulator